MTALGRTGHDASPLAQAGQEGNDHPFWLAMRVVVTGASGFIGSQLCSHLRSLRNEVVEIDLPHDDILETGSLTRALERARPDRVFHLAARSSVSASWRDPVPTWQTNAWGTLSLLKAARAAAPSARILVVSSASVFDGARCDRPIVEARTPAPLSPYGASKLAAETVARSYGAAHGLQVVVVRPFNIIGPSQGSNFLVPSLARRIVSAARSSQDGIAVGNLRTQRDFLDVRDAVRGLIRVMELGRRGEVYNLCSGIAVPIRSLVETLLSLADRPLAYHQDHGLLRAGDAAYLVGDPGMTGSQTGWRPTIPLAITLADVLAEAAAAASQERRPGRGNVCRATVLASEHNDGTR